MRRLAGFLHNLHPIIYRIILICLVKQATAYCLAIVPFNRRPDFKIILTDINIDLQLLPPYMS